MLSNFFVGQADAITQLQTAIEVSKKRSTILPHILLVAPPGCGKTRLAGHIALEVEAPYAKLAFPAEMRSVINVMLQHHGVLLLDEIHQAERKVLDMLLPFMDDRMIRHRRIMKRNDRLTLIAATTDPQKLPDAFVSRFRVRPPFKDYSVEEIKQIIHDGVMARRRSISDGTVSQLAEASLLNPRQALAFMETYIDLSELHESPVSADQVLQHLSISRRGLRHDHVQYLDCLERQGGVASQRTIAQMVFMPAESLNWVERDLLRLGLIGISSLGRELRSSEWRDDVTLDESEMISSDVNPYTLEHDA